MSDAGAVEEIVDNETPRFVTVKRPRDQRSDVALPRLANSPAGPLLNMLDNRLHAFENETGRVVCPAGDGAIKWTHLGEVWEETASPNKCPDCVKAIAGRSD
jgi:hypothetical protein